jgi:hypothetical protein
MMALLAALLAVIVADGGWGMGDGGWGMGDGGWGMGDGGWGTDERGLANPQLRTPNSQLPFLAAFIGGLGFAHHGLFVIAGLPILAAYLLWWLFQILDEGRRTNNERTALRLWFFVFRLGLCFAAGLLPWLYPLAQYARYGPFNGRDYGLPQHYFWGAPESWAQVLDLLIGGQMRRGIFRAPTLDSIMAVLRLVGRRLLFEFGPIGVPLGLLGSIALLRRARTAWLATAWIFFATLAYLLLLGPAVQDAPVFTLPMLLPWALWMAAGAEYALAIVRQAGKQTSRQRDRKTSGQGDKEIELVSLSRFRSLPVSLSRHSSLIVLLLIAATLAWGYTRLHVSSKRQLWLFRRFGEATLAQLPPGAAVITHWEQGMTLQYLIRVEGRRPDVWVDVVEPNDVSWRERARRYEDRALFFVGAAADVADLPVQLVREDEYADVFELRR